MRRSPLIYDCLFEWTNDFGIKPALAKKWEYTGNTLKINLRDDVLFHDGSGSLLKSYVSEEATEDIFNIEGYQWDDLFYDYNVEFYLWGNYVSPVFIIIAIYLSYYSINKINQSCRTNIGYP